MIFDALIFFEGGNGVRLSRSRSVPVFLKRAGNFQKQQAERPRTKVCGRSYHLGQDAGLQNDSSSKDRKKGKDLHQEIGKGGERLAPRQ